MLMLFEIGSEGGAVVGEGAVFSGCTVEGDVEVSTAGETKSSTLFSIEVGFVSLPGVVVGTPPINAG